MKIVVYYNNANTLGHSTRLSAIVKAIKASIPKSAVTMLDAGRSPQELLIDSGASVVQLPYGLDWKGRGIGMEWAEKENLSPKSMLAERLSRIREVLVKIKPDIFIVEHFPFSQGPWSLEIPLALDYVKKNVGCPIIGSVGYLNYAKNIYNHIDKYFSQILIHSPRKLALTYLEQLDRRSAKEIEKVLASFRDKIYYTGFVFDRSKCRSKEKIRIDIKRRGYRKLVFVSRGGGMWKDDLIITSLQAAAKRPEWFFVVCCGPATTLQDMSAYGSFCANRDNVQLLHYVSAEEFDGYLAAADVSVSLTGYNTALKLLNQRKRAVLIPHEITEQQWRSQWLREYIPAELLPGKSLEAGKLVSAIERVLDKKIPGRRMPAAWQDGIAQTVRVLKCLN